MSRQTCLAVSDAQEGAVRPKHAGDLRHRPREEVERIAGHNKIEALGGPGKVTVETGRHEVGFTLSRPHAPGERQPVRLECVDTGEQGAVVDPPGNRLGHEAEAAPQVEDVTNPGEITTIERDLSNITRVAGVPPDDARDYLVGGGMLVQAKGVQRHAASARIESPCRDILSRSRRRGTGRAKPDQPSRPGPPAPFQLFHRLGPGVLQQPGERSIGEDPPPVWQRGQ